MRVLFVCFFCSISFFVYSQSLNLPAEILKYQQFISLGRNQLFNENLDSAVYYFLESNKVKPLHYFHTMYVKNLLLRKFNRKLFEIVVATEIKQTGFCYALGDSMYTKFLKKNKLIKIIKKSEKFKSIYTNNSNRNLIKKINEVEILDQFARNFSYNSVFNMKDSSYYFKKQLIHFVDSVYLNDLVTYIKNLVNLKPEDLGQSYTQFSLLFRHLDRSDSNNYLFLNKAVNDFIITPDYYANVCDYVFNNYIGKDGIKHYKNTFAEFGFSGNYQITIDNPELIDNKRKEIGLLSLWESYYDKSKLPLSYKTYYEKRNNTIK